MNLGIAVAEAAIGFFTGNVGFYADSAHNTADAVGYGVTGSAMDAKPNRSRNLRRTSALILAAGGIATGVWAGVNAAEGHYEEANTVTILAAAGAAALNTKVSRKIHSAEHQDDHSHEEHGAQLDAKLHGILDSGTSWAYAGGLAAEHWVPGAANYVIVANGAISTIAAGVMIKRTLGPQQQRSYGHQH